MDYIIKPSDWETINLATEQDPNKFGEALRAYCFKGNCMEIGCYSTFAMMDFMKKVKAGHSIYEETRHYLWNEIEPTVYYYKIEEKDCYLESMEEKLKKYKICEPTEIVCGWTWDGDGCLYFRWNNRKVSNSDCKKDYTWEWKK